MNKFNDIYISIYRKEDAQPRSLRFIKAWKLEKFAYAWQQYMQIDDSACRWQKREPGHIADMLNDYVHKNALVCELWYVIPKRVTRDWDPQANVEYFTFTATTAHKVVRTECLMECLDFVNNKFPGVLTPQVVSVPYSGTVDFVGRHQRLCHVFEHNMAIVLGERCGVRVGGFVPRIAVGKGSVVFADIRHTNVTADAYSRVLVGAFSTVELCGSHTKVSVQDHSTVLSTNKDEQEIVGCDITTQQHSVVSLHNPYDCKISVGRNSIVHVVRNAATNMTLKFILRVQSDCRVFMSNGGAHRNTRVELQAPGGTEPGQWYSVMAPLTGKATFTKIKVDAEDDEHAI